MPSKIIFTLEQEDYIKENYLKLSSRKLAEYCNCDRGVIQRYLKKHKLIVPSDVSEKFRRDAMKGRTTFSEEESEFIKENYLTMPVKTIATHINRSGTGVKVRMRQLNLVVPREIIEQRKKDSMFKKGMIPVNKGKKQHEYMSAESIEKTKATRFQKGQKPTNTKYDGHERISKDGYVEIRVSEGNYQLKHRVVWESVNGKIPKGHCISFKDGNPSNVNITNLELISREENMFRNSKHNYPQEIIPSLVLLNKLNKQINNKENG
jgi:hypothetical protein